MARFFVLAVMAIGLDALVPIDDVCVCCRSNNDLGASEVRK